jgi:hypothetical protein
VNSTSTDRQATFLINLGLNPEAPGLVTVPEAPKRTRKAKPKAALPENAHTMPVEDITFDPAWIEGMDLDAAGKWLFDQFKGEPRKDHERNGLLWRKKNEFIARQRVARKVGPAADGVTAKIKAGKPERDLAAIIAAAGLTEDDVLAFIESRKESSAL